MLGNPFDYATQEYAQVRPSYPLEAVDMLIAGATEVADIGAGTGKMTRLLAKRGLHVSAVEPAAAMRLQLEQMLLASGQTRQSAPVGGAGASGIMDEVPSSGAANLVQGTPLEGISGTVEVLAGSAEDTGLTDKSVDLAVFAQSWHWVDPEAASTEMARILRPCGRIAAVWNQLDVSVPWVKRLTRIMRSGDVHRPDRPPLFDHQLFTTPHLELFEWSDEKSADQVMALARTRSSWLREDEAGREHMQNNLRWYLHEHLGYGDDQLIQLPYVTLVWVSTVRYM